jgi:hypothetical protein
MGALHKDNAIFTVAFWLQAGSLAAIQGLFGTDGGNNANVGVEAALNITNGAGLYQVRNGSTPFGLNQPTTAVTAGAWSFWALSYSEPTGAGGVLWRTNTLVDANTSTYTSPSASAASYPMQLGAVGNNARPAFSGFRMSKVAFWNRAMKKADLQALYNATRPTFGI